MTIPLCDLSTCCPMMLKTGASTLYIGVLYVSLYIHRVACFEVCHDESCCKVTNYSWSIQENKIKMSARLVFLIKVLYMSKRLCTFAAVFSRATCG